MTPPALDRDRIAATAASIEAVQEADGAIPWTPGQHTDPWNHIEAAMGLLLGGRRRAAERAYDWCLATQRPDGSWPMKTVEGTVVDDSGDTNASAYLAVGVWHHWLICRDLAFVRRAWPAVRDGLTWVAGRQLAFGGIAWSQPRVDGVPTEARPEALLAGSSSIYQALRTGLALADLLGRPQPEWELVAGRLGHALRAHRDRFLDKRTFSMDWYYPVLGGAVRGRDAADLLASRWSDFVVDGLGVRCVDTNPWVTGAESCELVLALEALGDRATAARLFADVQHLRADDGAYWTGLVYPEGVHWPGEHTTYTAAAVLLAADALDDRTPGADIMRGRTLGAHPTELALECGCERSADRIARRA